MRSLAASPRRSEAALESALEGAEHALETVEGSGEAFAFLVRYLQLGDVDRGLGALQGLVPETIVGGTLEPRPQLLELAEELLGLLLASLPFRRLLLAEHPLLVGLGGDRISSSVRPEEAVTVMLCLRPVCTSMAETETMPSAEMSKMTSMSTSPRLALRSPVIMNSPSSSLWAAISLSPCSTVIFAEV